jgi:DNA repair protein RadC
LKPLLLTAGAFFIGGNRLYSLNKISAMEESSGKMPIREWAEDDRPREKLINKGTAVLSDAELIAILIGSGNQSESAVDLSKKILASVDKNLISLSKLSISDLRKFKGIGEAKAVTIAAALELGKRRRRAEAVEPKKITSSKQAHDILQEYLADANYEQFCVLLLNRANHHIRTITVSDGGISGTVADPKKIFKVAIDNNASSIILGHNHPSGQVIPSDADIALTRKLCQAGSLLDMPVLDHIIVGEEKYYSFRDEGKIE